LRSIFGVFDGRDVEIFCSTWNVERASGWQEQDEIAAQVGQYFLYKDPSVDFVWECRKKNRERARYRQRTRTVFPQASGALNGAPNKDVKFECSRVFHVERPASAMQTKQGDHGYNDRAEENLSNVIVENLLIGGGGVVEGLGIYLTGCSRIDRIDNS
jgi:hypothetical protein